MEDQTLRDQTLMKVQKRMNALLEKNKKLVEDNKQLKEKAKEIKHTHSRVSKLPKSQVDANTEPEVSKKATNGKPETSGTQS